MTGRRMQSSEIFTVVSPVDDVGNRLETAWRRRMLASRRCQLAPVSHWWRTVCTLGPHHILQHISINYAYKLLTIYAYCQEFRLEQDFCSARRRAGRDHE